MYKYDYQEFYRRVKNGDILIVVDPAMARKFYFEMDTSSLMKVIGEDLLNESFLVNLCGVLGMLLLVVEIIISIFVLKWYAIIAIPIIVKAFTYIVEKASLGRQNIISLFVIVALFAWLAFYLKGIETLMTIWLILLPFPYLFSSLMYKLATTFLRSLVIRNEKAFYLLYKYISLISN
jgi:hypothetical protein